MGCKTIFVSIPSVKFRVDQGFILSGNTVELSVHHVGVFELIEVNKTVSIGIDLV